MNINVHPGLSITLLSLESNMKILMNFVHDLQKTEGHADFLKCKCSRQFHF